MGSGDNGQCGGTNQSLLASVHEIMLDVTTNRCNGDNDVRTDAAGIDVTGEQTIACRTGTR